MEIDLNRIDRQTDLRRHSNVCFSTKRWTNVMGQTTDTDRQRDRHRENNQHPGRHTDEQT